MPVDEITVDNMPVVDWMTRQNATRRNDSRQNYKLPYFHAIGFFNEAYKLECSSILIYWKHKAKY